MKNKTIFLSRSSSKKKEIIVDSNQNYTLLILETADLNSDSNIHVNLMNNSEIRVIVSTLATKSTRKKINIFINHIGNNAKSSIETYSISTEKSKIEVFITTKINSGTIGNETVQMIKGTLLSKNSKIIGRPTLLIDDNNVRAKHSMAIGQISSKTLFFLMSKGLTKNESIQIIIFGYFDILLNALLDETKKKKYRRILLNKFKILKYEPVKK